MGLLDVALFNYNDDLNIFYASQLELKIQRLRFSLLLEEEMANREHEFNSKLEQKKLVSVRIFAYFKTLHSDSNLNNELIDYQVRVTVLFCCWPLHCLTGLLCWSEWFNVFLAIDKCCKQNSLTQES